MSDSETTSNGSLAADLDAELALLMEGDESEQEDGTSTTEFAFNTPAVDPITPQLTGYKAISRMDQEQQDLDGVATAFSHRIAALEPSPVQLDMNRGQPAPSFPAEHNLRQLQMGDTLARTPLLELPLAAPVTGDAAESMEFQLPASPGLEASTSTEPAPTTTPAMADAMEAQQTASPPAFPDSSASGAANAPSSGHLAAAEPTRNVKRRRVLLTGRRPAAAGIDTIAAPDMAAEGAQAGMIPGLSSASGGDAGGRVAGGAGAAGSAAAGSTVARSGADVEVPECPPHPGYWNGLCTRCGAPKLDAEEQDASEQTLAIKHLHSAQLEISTAEAMRIRDEQHARLLAAGKLTLVLDLDHTLLHSVRTVDVLPQHSTILMRVLASQDAAGPGRPRLLHYLPDKNLWTKLRPGVFGFLSEMQEFFELCIYTMGDRYYAREVARILDPGGRLFAGRVVAKDDGTTGDTKSLDVLLSREQHVLVLDDTEQVWRQHPQNLIQVERYHYFPCRDHLGQPTPHSFLESGMDESASGGMLAVCSRVLREVHTRLFTQDDMPLAERDVRYHLSSVRSSILAGCSIVFSRCWPTDFPNPWAHPLWSLAEALGAECSTSYNPATTTHVVAASAGTDKVVVALGHGKHVVSRDWLLACSARWERMPEADFSLAASAARRAERASGRMLSTLPSEPSATAAAAEAPANGLSTPAAAARDGPTAAATAADAGPPAAEPMDVAPKAAAAQDRAPEAEAAGTPAIIAAIADAGLEGVAAGGLVGVT